MARRLGTAGRVAVALWRYAWRLPPRYCLRHWLDVALRCYGYRDYGDPACPRCRPYLVEHDLADL